MHPGLYIPPLEKKTCCLALLVLALFLNANGTQEGLYVPANELFDMVFGEHWSDAHRDVDGAVNEVADLVTAALASEGKVWIADGGQSDFSASVMRAVQAQRPDLEMKGHIHILQDADWTWRSHLLKTRPM